MTHRRTPRASYRGFSRLTVDTIDCSSFSLSNSSHSQLQYFIEIKQLLSAYLEVVPHQYKTSTMTKSPTDSPSNFSPLPLQRVSSAPSTPTGKRQSIDPPLPLRRRTSSYHPGMSSPHAVPKPHRRCCTLPIVDLELSESSSSSVTTITSKEESSSIASLENTLRSVHLFDLIDEEFVVNRCIMTSAAAATASKSGPVRRKKKRLNILDMIDRIVEEDDELSSSSNCNDLDDGGGGSMSSSSASFMTERSYPRGVFVVPPTSNRYLKVGNVGFVAAEAFDQWTE